MDILTVINDAVVSVMDCVLNWWLLYLPRPVAVVILGLGSSLIMNQLRVWTTDQGRLLRARNDLTRLKELLRAAKRRKDKASVLRIRQTVGTIQLMKMKAEGLPLLACILPITFLALWAFARLDYHPARTGEPLVVRTYYDVSSIAKLAILMPSKDFDLQSAAMQEVREYPYTWDAKTTYDAGDCVTRDKPQYRSKRNGNVGHEPPDAMWWEDVSDSISAVKAQGIAKWKILPKPERSAIVLERRFEGSIVRMKVEVGSRTYLTPYECYPKTQNIEIEVGLKQATFWMPQKWVDWLGGYLGCPPWLVAYLVVLIAGVPLMRKVMHIY